MISAVGLIFVQNKDLSGMVQAKELDGDVFDFLS